MDNQQESLDLMPIPDHPDYFASHDGSIYSTKRSTSPRQLKPHLHQGRGGQPYLRISLSGKLYLVHRLVVSASIGRFISGHELVNHKNGVKTDNSVTNLEIVTHQENVAHAMAHKLYTHGDSWYKARNLQRPEQ